MKRFFAFVVAHILLFATSSVHSAPAQFEKIYCQNIIAEKAVNEIVREVFDAKAKALASRGKLSIKFWNKNKDLIFAVCDNGASYETFVVHGKGVVFDYQMIGFLFSQARALMVGRYISLEKQFYIHAELVRQFAKQGPELDRGPLAIIEIKASNLGMNKEAYYSLLSNPEFKKREQTVFLQAMYFLAMHERCHVALDHGLQFDKILKKANAERQIMKHRQEFEADRCALEIVNSDEEGHRSSPISFFGVLMTVATQAIVAAQESLTTERSHPSTTNRIAAATDITLAYISESGPSAVQAYEPTIKGTSVYFNELLKSLPSTNHD